MRPLPQLDRRQREGRGIARLWDYWAGAFLVLSVTILPFALPIEPSWLAVLAPTAAVLTLPLLAIVLRSPVLLVGGWSVALMAAFPAAMVAISGIIRLGSTVCPTLGLASIAGLVASCAGSFGLSALVERTQGRGSRLVRSASAAAAWFGSLTIIALVTWPGFSSVTQVVLGLFIGAVLAAAAPRLGNGVLRAAVVTTAHAVVLLSAITSWADTALRLLAGVAVVAVVLLLGRALPVAARAMYMGVAYAYALIIAANGLESIGLETIAVLCITASIGSLFALLVTLVTRVSVREWYVILCVTAAPFLIGVGSVIAVRSGWTALSTGVTLALALTLVVSRRPGLTRVLRAAAAALAVPSLAVVVVCLGAQLIPVSASPIVLPVIAGIVALALPLTGVVGRALERPGLEPSDARAVRVSIEVSSLVTGAIAVALALLRVAAGLDTTLLVLMLIGCGGAATAILVGRRYGWIVAATSWTAALWCFWALQEVSLIEAYTLPPALGGVAIGAIGVALKKPARWIFTLGLAVTILPTLTAIALGSGGLLAVRATALLATSLVLVISAIVLRRGNRIKQLVIPTLGGAVVAAAGGMIQAMRFGWQLDPLTLANPNYAILPALAFSVLAATLATAAARVARRGGSRSRWIYAPAMTFLVLGTVTAIRRDWLPVAVLATLMLLLLLLMLATVSRARSHRTTLPPVWFTYLLAWLTAVVAWSPRDLRVEAFSLPLGFALLTAGLIAMRRSMTSRTTFNSWPHGFRGSWQLLTPGIVAILLPSTVATGTDPLTARAILVIGLALIAVLIGSLRKIAAPFVLGIVVLPIENVIVFAVQVGRSISAAPWWITLATAGAVLLVIAVTYERRDKTAGGFSARLRDLK